MYSKLHQEQYAYKLEINIKETICPVCHHKNLKMNGDGGISCRCGFISSIVHEYVAGIRVDNDLDFKIEKITKNGVDLE